VPRWIRVLIAYLRLPHFVPIVCVLAATAGFALILGGRDLDRSRLVALLLAMLGSQIVIGVVNELVDLDLDAATRPEKPIPAGLVSVRGAIRFGIAAAILMLAEGMRLGWAPLLLLLIGTGVGVAYSVWFKRSRLAWLPYLGALPLVPIWVAVAVDAFSWSLLALFPIGALGVVAIQLAQSVPDIEQDRRGGIDSLSTRLGERGALRVVWGALLLTGVLALIGAAILSLEMRWVAVAVALVTASVVSNMLIYHRSRRVGVLAAFPSAALALGAMAFAWVAATT
jgi:4-hydroxybenzoate polyprenyltransferase